MADEDEPEDELGTDVAAVDVGWMGGPTRKISDADDVAWVLDVQYVDGREETITVRTGAALQALRRFGEADTAEKTFYAAWVELRPPKPEFEEWVAAIADFGFREP